MAQEAAKNIYYLYEAFPNIDRAFIDDVVVQCKYDMYTAAEMLSKMCHDVRPSQPNMFPNPNVPSGNMNSWCFPQRQAQSSGSPARLPNEYIHKFEMKQGDVLPSKTSTPIKYDQIYVNHPPRMIKTQPVDDNVPRNNNDLINFTNDTTQSAQNKDSIPVGEIYKQLEANKEIMAKLLDFIQNQLQVKEVESVKVEEEVATPPISAKEQLEMYELEKKQEELKKLQKLQEAVDDKIEKNKEAVIVMLDNFKSEIQTYFAENMKTLVDVNDEKLETLVTEQSLEDTEAGPSLPQQDNNTTEDDNLNQSVPNIPDGITSLITNGYKVMILMRGLPGSGKSTLASSILYDSLGKVNLDEFIFSTNDYFKITGSSAEDFVKTEEAHAHTRRRCYKAMERGVSPVIIDNNNLQIDEMKFYCMVAAMYGYIIEIVEPKTQWAQHPAILAEKSSCGISEQKIKEMIKDFQENITVDDLKETFNLIYKQDIPQIREYPPFRKSK